ncbi:uncharacterized protein LOC100257121 [Vitis vinifera]|uniref:Protein downstream neighbor of Son n=1 Tax=Vitis vinifera TaxID=29760 RepID=D7TUE6_VITVI|eukprot:XP_010648208.1 PREDICTED: protein downstream neighbor of Son [Vitis vinifera]
MAKVATAGPLSSNSIRFGGVSGKVEAGVKRKTPSELRGEQLKRRNVIELVDESPAPLLGSTRNTNELKKQDVFKVPRYIDTRMDEVFPARKSRFRMLPGKENAKEDISTEPAGCVKNMRVSSNSVVKSHPQLSCPENTVASAAVSKDGTRQDCEYAEKCSQSTFRSVAELSLGSERISEIVSVDMDRALKGLVAREPPAFSGLAADSSEKFGNLTSISSGNFCSEFHIPGQKAPLDFTLKTNMQIVSSSSVNWFHRLNMSATYNGTTLFTPQFGCSKDQNISCSSGLTSTAQIFNYRALHSWVHPQSSLPPSVISALTLSAAEGDFLIKRQLAWEDSFRSLYYMLRKNICNIFYVCTSQFVVVFAGGDGSGGKKQSCNAYISQSTRGLRSLLREHDVCFSMPLCHSKVEQATTEDLVELSEIEKCNLGQTRRLGSISDVDNSPQSLLSFSGNKNVHALYDFMLNYRSFLTSLTSVDVPLLYSPVPFQNAALSAPEVSCRELKRADHVAFPLKGSKMKDEAIESVSAGLSYSIEIKDAYIPPWIISSICATMGSEGRSFEASFTTEPTSIGLNAAVETVGQKSDTQAATGEAIQESTYAFGVPEAVVTSYMHSAFLKGLKYANGSYTARLSPV